MGDKRICLSWETDSQLQGKEVRITLPWERFKRLREEGTLEKDEISKLQVEGRITVHGAMEAGYVRPRPKFLPGHEQKVRKRVRAKGTYESATVESAQQEPLPIGASKHREPRRTHHQVR